MTADDEILQVLTEREAQAPRDLVTARNGEAISSKPLPKDALILIPVRNVVLFPGMIVPLVIGRERSIAAAREAARIGAEVGVVLQRSAADNSPGPNDLYRIGTVVTILRYFAGPDNSHHVVCQGESRFRIIEFLDGYPFLVARVAKIEEDPLVTKEVEARFHNLKQRAIEIIQLLPQAPAELMNAVQGITAPALLADLVAGLMDMPIEEKQEILETFDLEERLDKLLKRVAHRLEVLHLSQQISEQTKENMDERQREYLLREQLKTIQKELGEGDDHAAEVAELDEAIAKAQMPEDVEQHARKELKRLERTPEASGEYSMIRTYLEWLVELPWKLEESPPININEARQVLNDEHFGLDKVKRRILEFLAVRKLNPEGKSPILCFVGPPGVGKTSLGQSIAKSTGRKFMRISLGGVHDEAEIRGHRRTYIGALPGNIIQSIRKAGTRNCVLMLDEIDKLGAGGFHGDPASALLEVLDPEQNINFRDNYLSVAFDLSKVMFICTANMLETIPGPLRDRMEVIALPGYTEEEKLQIARRYLVQRQMEANGLTAEQCQVSDAALREIISDYTREAGVRNLEREIGAVFRHAAMKVAEGSTLSMHIETKDIEAILGAHKFESEVAMRTGVPGVATGLAWTPVGGDILFIEASRLPGNGKLILTGQLGEVMKESAQAALSLLKARSESLGINPEIFEKNDIHIHVPAGATPKDGPSAGVAILMALVSMFTNRCVRPDLAMTGEISLRGLVLPVGGIKEKVLAALRAGITHVMLPGRNKRDWEDIPAEAREQMQFTWLEKVDEAVAVAFRE